MPVGAQARQQVVHSDFLALVDSEAQLGPVGEQVRVVAGLLQLDGQQGAAAPVAPQRQSMESFAPDDLIVVLGRARQ